MKKKTEYNAPKISIIVPIYNVQGYLEKCLNSLLTQTFKDIEIICVNDGSTDNSLTILQDFAVKDKRIIIIDKPNEGVSAARNVGLKKASGKYVMFVDGDDWLEPETCAECYTKITQDHSDMLAFNFKDVFSNNKVQIHDKLQAVPYKHPFLFSKCPDEFFYIMTSVCGKLFKRHNNIKFSTNIKKGEDAVYYWEYCLKFNPQISIINKAFYNYLKRENSAMKSVEFVNDCEILKSVKTLVDKDCFKKATKRLQYHILDRFSMSLIWEINNNTTNLTQDYFAKIKWFVDLFNEYTDSNKLLFYPRLRDIYMINSRKIDLVYLWVDGNDNEWRKKKNYWKKQCGLPVNDADNQDCRYIDNQELRYSLRSAEMFAPWINKIFIVTSGQVPEWLDISNPKIKIISDEQIMPKDALPTFNSPSIESCLANIPELSEYFLYACDDFFFGNKVKPDYFFDAEGKPVIRMIRHNWSPDKIKNLLYQNMVYNAKELICNKMHKDFGNMADTHNIVPYRKSMFAACAQKFKKEFMNTTYCKFREKGTIHRVVVTFFTMIKLKIEPRIIDIHCDNKQTDEIIIDLTNTQNTLNRLQATHPKLFCINDNEKTKEEDRVNLKYLLAMLFPMPAIWEKDFGVNGSILLQIKSLNSKPVVTNKPTVVIKQKNPPSLRLYLFGFIPLYKITYREQQTIFKLFNFLTLFKFKRV